MDGALIFLFAAILIVGVILFAVITFGKRSSTLNVEKYRTRWLTIEQSIKRDDDASCHIAILNADKLVDQALREKGFKGQTMGERLKAAKNSLPHRDNIWQAHKLRNQIAHEPDVRIDYDKTRRALAQFKQTLKDLGAI
jgi:hypothetical protein